MKILLAVDGSPHSQEAVDEVRQRPWPAGSRVRALFVVQPVVPPTADFAIGAPWPEEVWKEQHRAAAQTTASVARSLGSTALEVESVVREGDPRTEIIAEATEWGADLIVLGSHGHTRLERLLLGSVANAVINNSPCSVEVVRHPEPRAA